MREIYSFVR